MLGLAAIVCIHFVNGYEQSEVRTDKKADKIHQTPNEKPMLQIPLSLRSCSYVQDIDADLQSLSQADDGGGPD
jgi:hypothetical protein